MFHFQNPWRPDRNYCIVASILACLVLKHMQIFSDCLWRGFLMLLSKNWFLNYIHPLILATLRYIYFVIIVPTFLQGLIFALQFLCLCLSTKQCDINEFRTESFDNNNKNKCTVSKNKVIWVVGILYQTYIIHLKLSHRGVSRLKEISTLDFSTPSFNPRLFNHELSNDRLFNPEAKRIFQPQTPWNFQPGHFNHELDF